MGIAILIIKCPFCQSPEEYASRVPECAVRVPYDDEKGIDPPILGVTSRCLVPVSVDWKPEMWEFMGKPDFKTGRSLRELSTVTRLLPTKQSQLDPAPMHAEIEA